jgi:predicted Zn-ribbon and HTH transcriptional regulator
MKNRSKEPVAPVERHETIRREIMDVLEDRLLSAMDISGNVGIPVKEVYDHLEHIRRTLNIKSLRLSVTPAECKKCGFVFKKRGRLKKPGKCPVCRGESIEDPLFSIRAADNGAEDGERWRPKG